MEQLPRHSPALVVVLVPSLHQHQGGLGSPAGLPAHQRLQGIGRKRQLGTARLEEIGQVHHLAARGASRRKSMSVAADPPVAPRRAGHWGKPGASRSPFPYLTAKRCRRPDDPEISSSLWILLKSALSARCGS